MLKIEIATSLNPELSFGYDLRAQVDQAMHALGFKRTEMPAVTERTFTAEDLKRVDPTEMRDPNLYSLPETNRAGDRPEGQPETVLDEPSVQAFVRKRGEPTPPRKRRTKEEIAEDEAADAADAARAQQDGAAETPQISVNPENRVGPEDAPEVQEQDRADEAAETAATKTGLTLDDVRQANGRYMKAFGMAAAARDIPALLGKAVVELTEAEIYGAIKAIDNAITAGQAAPAQPAAEPAKEPAPAKEPDPAPATKQDVVNAMMAYAKKFDGPNADPNDPTSVPVTLEDAPRVFELVCGDGVNRLSLIPAEKYAEVVSGLGEALVVNPFKRVAK